MNKSLIVSACALACALVVSNAYALNKCTSVEGYVTYSDILCPSASEGKIVKIASLNMMQKVVYVPPKPVEAPIQVAVQYTKPVVKEEAVEPTFRHFKRPR